MNEKSWVSLMIEQLQPRLQAIDSTLEISQGQKLPYAKETRVYRNDEPVDHRAMRYETDILITESKGGHDWLPRLIIEAKINRVTTHDAITYSQKAITHKAVHPYLRYGIILGHRKHYPLPSRLYRHGAHSDFMMSFVDFKPTAVEIDDLTRVIELEVAASRQLEEIIYNSRSANRERYYLLHRPLQLKG